MQTALLVIHLIISCILIGLVLLQSGKGGLGRAFGGDVVYRSKRGAERIVFVSTFVIAFLFFLTSIVSILVR